MHRYNPVIAKYVVVGTLSKIYTAPTKAQPIPAVIENQGAATIRLVFSLAPSPPTDVYVSVPPGGVRECNPDTNVWAYSPSGVASNVCVATGIRYISGSVGDASAVESGVADSSSSSSSVLPTQKELLAMIVAQNEQLVEQNNLMLTYFAEWQGEELKTQDALQL